MLKRVFTYYGAGAAGALITTFAAWFAADQGWIRQLGSQWSPHGNAPGIYGHLVWGGVSALGYLLLDSARLSWIRGGLILALIPAAAELLYCLPTTGAGYFGSALGGSTWAVISFLCLIWGWSTVFLGTRAK